jgi:hypothetical protein
MSRVKVEKEGINVKGIIVLTIMLLTLCSGVAPVYADMLVVSELSHAKVLYSNRNAAYLRSIIYFKNVNTSVYEPIAEAIRRFNPIQTYFLFPNNPHPDLNRLRAYNIPPLNIVEDPIVWFNPSLQRGVDVIVYNPLPETYHQYGDMFPVFFNMSLNDEERSIKIVVEIPDSELITFGNYLVFYPPFLGLKEYPNGTDEYFFDRRLFDAVLPAIREGLLAILRSMTTGYYLGCWSSEYFRFDMWTPSVVKLGNGTVLNNVTSISVDWWKYSPWEVRKIRTYEFKEPVSAIIFMRSDGSVQITIKNGESIIIPKGRAVRGIPNPDYPTGINWSNFTRATITLANSVEFFVEDGTLWTPVRDYLIWNNETVFLRNLEDAISKLDDALTFEWLKEPLENWKESYWNETIKLNNGTKINEKLSLQIFNKTDENYSFLGEYLMDDGTLYLTSNKWLKIVNSNGTTLTFNDNTKVSIKTLEAQRNIVFENGELIEIKTHRSLYLQSEIPWPYGDPEAFISIPSNAYDVKVKGDILTFKVQKVSTYAEVHTFNDWRLPAVAWGVIIIVSIGIIAGIKILRAKSRRF